MHWKHPIEEMGAHTPLHSHSPSETGLSETSLVEFPGRERLASYSSFRDLTRHAPPPPSLSLNTHMHIHKQCACKHESRLLLKSNINFLLTGERQIIIPSWRVLSFWGHRGGQSIKMTARSGVGGNETIIIHLLWSLLFVFSWQRSEEERVDAKKMQCHFLLKEEIELN